MAIVIIIFLMHTFMLLPLIRHPRRYRFRMTDIFWFSPFIVMLLLGAYLGVLSIFQPECRPETQGNCFGIGMLAALFMVLSMIFTPIAMLILHRRISDKA